MRKERKIEHIENYLKTEYIGDNLFDCVQLEHHSLPDINFDRIDTSQKLFGKNVGFPILINAMTGGGEVSTEINADLAEIAQSYDLPIAVGSEQIAMDDESALDSFQVVRRVLGSDGIVIGNLNAQTNLKTLKRAAEVIEADAMQLHLNVAQELVMSEGDRDFEGILKNIEKLKKQYKKPIIVKEVGFGISKANVRRLMEVGIDYIDVSGSGGTNFMEIENLRRTDIDFSEFFSWGNPTAQVLIEAREVSDDLFLIASGGIRSSIDIVKAIVMGADLVGISGEILNFLLRGGYTYAREYMDQLTYKFKIGMNLVGAADIKSLKHAPYRVHGVLRDLLQEDIRS